MPGNKGGKKKRKGKKNQCDTHIKHFIEKEEGQEYGQVLAVLGDCRFRLLCADGKERLGILRGKMRKKQWVTLGSFVIVGIREFENGKCDIFHVYQDSQHTKVRTFFTSSDKLVGEEEDDNGFEFDDDSDEINIDDI